jgi:hypothetical protein
VLRVAFHPATAAFFSPHDLPAMDGSRRACFALQLVALQFALQVRLENGHLLFRGVDRFTGEVFSMRLLYHSTFLLLALAAVSVAAPAQDKIEVFAGYSYLRPEMTYTEVQGCEVIICPPPVPTSATAHPNLNGYEFSATYKPMRWLGATADFSGHYGTVAGHSSGHVQTFLFGPQVSLPARVSPFFHGLFGAAHEAIGSSVPVGGFGPTILSSSGNFFAVAVGIGIDLHVAPFLSVRPIQVDYLATRAYSSTQNQPRVSAGVVVHF